MKKLMMPILVVCGMVQFAYSDCNDTRVIAGPGNDAGTCAACAGTGSPIADYPKGNVCLYSTWGDVYECGPQGTGESPTGNVCSCMVENRTVNVYQGTCNGKGACSNGTFVYTLEEKRQVDNAVLTAC